MTQAGGPPLALIARSIRRERERVGLSLSELAKQAGIAKSTLSQLESGTGNPSVETLWALGVALGVPFSNLRDIYVIRAGPGGARESDPHGPGTMEHVWIGSGKAFVGPVGELVELSPGDYAAYPGDVPHVFEAVETGTAGVIVMEHR